MNRGGYEAFAKPVALVTGASSGLGRALAQGLYDEGYDVLASGRNEKALRELTFARPFPADLSRPEGPEELYRAVTGAGLGVDLLVNNAGLGYAGALLDQDPGSLRDISAVNVTAPAVLCRLFVPGMAARGRGGVINICSTGAWEPGPFMAAYYASKSYELSLTWALRSELKGSGVRVCAVCPGAIASGFSARAGRRDPARAMDPAAVARAALQGYAKGRALVVPGAANKLGHLVFRALPAPVSAWVVGRYQRGLLRPGPS